MTEPTPMPLPPDGQPDPYFTGADQAPTSGDPAPQPTPGALIATIPGALIGAV